MSALEERIEKAKQQQTVGAKALELKEALPEDTERVPTLYEKSAEMIVKKLFAPANMHETQIVSKIPQQILTNIMSMQAIEHGMHSMIDGPTLEITTKEGKDIVIIYDKITDKNGKEQLVIRKKMSYNQFRRAKLYTQFMTGFTSNLLEELPAVSGKPGDTRAEQGITAIASLTNSERMLLEAQNNQNAGLLKKIWRKVF